MTVQLLQLTGRALSLEEVFRSLQQDEDTIFYERPSFIIKMILGIMQTSCEALQG